MECGQVAQSGDLFGAGRSGGRGCCVVQFYNRDTQLAALHVDIDSPRAAKAFNLMFLQCTQTLLLQLKRDVADLIRNLLGAMLQERVGPSCLSGSRPSQAQA